MIDNFHKRIHGLTLFSSYKIIFAMHWKKWMVKQNFMKINGSVKDNGGGGKSRIIQNGNVFEKGGVNTSVVYGEVTDVMRKQLKIEW